MADPRQVKEALGDVEQALAALQSTQANSIPQVQAAVQDLLREIEQRIEELEHELKLVKIEVDKAESDLSDCEKQQYEHDWSVRRGDYDDAGRVPQRPDCRSEESNLQRAGDELSRVIGEIRHYAILRDTLASALDHYMSVADPVQTRLEKTTQAAVPWLRNRQEALAKFDQGGDV